ncbi:MAG TPA: PepSY-associated TM helix domain-containing protein [Burkholderiales bacterium]|nr:PepSY-associated TM helix domain-containing protein [Burkholderiales bacterium]
MMRNIWFQLHWLIGITAGSVLIVVGVTGAILSFEPELSRAMNPAVMNVTPQRATLSPDALVGRINAAVPEKRIAALTLASSPQESARVTFAPEPPAKRGESRYVNPYSGELLGKPAGEEFFRFVIQLHRYLAAGDIGKHIVGASTLGVVYLALSGLYLRWPATVFSVRSWLALRWSLKGRNFWWELHSVLGTWVLVVYLFAALTGLYWSYEWYRDAMFAVTGAPKPAQQQAGGGADKAGGGPSITDAEIAKDLGRAWGGFRSQIEHFETATIRMPSKAGKPVQITYLDRDPPHLRAVNRILIDPASGNAVEHERYADKPMGAKIMSSVYALHTGRFFGLPGVVILAIASLAMAISGISGWLLYLDRRRKKARRKERILARA